MNLRILKKLSKRAAPYLPLLGDTREHFLSEAGDNYHGMVISARKHWERSCAIHGEVRPGGYVLTPKCRIGHRFPFIHVYQPSHPWPRTAMVGAVSGYYESEWDEESAWGALDSIVREHFFDYQTERLTRRLRGPSDVFKAADELIASGLRVAFR